MNMTSPSGMNLMTGTPTYSTDSIVGDYSILMDGPPCAQLKKYLEPYSQEELRKLIHDVSKDNSNFCNALLAEIKRDKKWCKLFVHGLAFSTSKVESLLHFANALSAPFHWILYFLYFLYTLSILRLLSLWMLFLEFNLYDDRHHLTGNLGTGIQTVWRREGGSSFGGQKRK